MQCRLESSTVYMYSCLGSGRGQSPRKKEVHADMNLDGEFCIYN